MKVLIDPQFIIEYILNRENDLKSEIDKLWKFLHERHPHIQTCLSRYGVDKIYNICKIHSQKSADNFINQLESLFIIHESSSKVFKQVRQYQGDIDAAIELYSAIEMNCSALITPQTNKYINNSSPSLSIWTIKDLLDDNLNQRKKLEESLKISSDEYYFQKARFEVEQPSLFSQFHGKPIVNYRIRNNIQTILKALNLLKKAGYKGLTKEQLSEQMNKKSKTIDSIFWDLERTEMIVYDNRTTTIVIKKSLLDTNDDDIAKYLATVLKQHIVVEKIYKHLENGKLLNRWGLEKIIKETYSLSSDKTVRDYRSRLYSWLEFANLLEERGGTTLRIPNQDQTTQSIQNVEPSQLTLFDLSKYVECD
ncbi:MAG: hypothetical protein AB4041_06955 [Microcystaceae cyanobacterium]